MNRQVRAWSPRRALNKKRQELKGAREALKQTESAGQAQNMFSVNTHRARVAKGGKNGKIGPSDIAGETVNQCGLCGRQFGSVPEEVTNRITLWPSDSTHRYIPGK